MSRAQFPLLCFLLLIGTPLMAQASADSTFTPAGTVHAAAQIASGFGFDDAVFGFNTRSRRMSLAGLTISTTESRFHNALLLFLLEGSFLDAAGQPSGESTRLQAEWTSKFTFLHQRGARPAFYFSGQLSRDGAGYRADGLGLGVRTVVAAGVELAFTAYGRSNESSARDMKGRVEWEVPFRVAGFGLHFNGYEDVVGSRPRATEWSGVWQLLLRCGRLIDRQPERVEVGLKYFNHVSPVHTTSAPLLMLRWEL